MPGFYCISHIRFKAFWEFRFFYRVYFNLHKYSNTEENMFLAFLLPLCTITTIYYNFKCDDENMYMAILKNEFHYQK